MTRFALTFKVGVSLFVPAAILALWWIFFLLKGDETSYAIGPHQAIGALIDDWSTIWPETLISCWRLALGVLIGVILGTVAGIGVARSFWYQLIFGPTLQVFLAIPFIVWIPFMLMALGLGDMFRVSVVVLCTFLLIYGHCFHAIRQLNPDYIELARVYEKSRQAIWFSILLPAAMRQIVVGTRQSFVLGWIALSLAEQAVGIIPGGGLGYYILRARDLGQPNIMFGGVIVLAFAALAVDEVLRRLQLHMSRWSKSQDDFGVVASLS